MSENWVPQAEVSSATARTLSRTAWLEPFRDRIHAAIQASHAEDEATDTYTQAVFDVLPPRVLLDGFAEKLRRKGRPVDLADAAARERMLSTIRTDVGMRVAIELVALYGADRVETLRKPGSRSVETRATGGVWPANYTPHRVRLAASPAAGLPDVVFTPEFPGRALWGAVLASWQEVLAGGLGANADPRLLRSEAALLALFSGALWRQPGAVGACRGGARRLWFALHGSHLELSVRVSWPGSADTAGLLASALRDEAWRDLGAGAGEGVQQAGVVIVVPVARVPPPAGARLASDIMDAAWRHTAGEGAVGAARSFRAGASPFDVQGVSHPGGMLMVFPRR